MSSLAQLGARRSRNGPRLRDSNDSNGTGCVGFRPHNLSNCVYWRLFLLGSPGKYRHLCACRSYCRNTTPKIEPGEIIPNSHYLHLGCSRKLITSGISDKLPVPRQTKPRAFSETPLEAAGGVGLHGVLRFALDDRLNDSVVELRGWFIVP